MIRKIMIKESPSGLTKLFRLEGRIESYYVQYKETVLPLLFSLEKAELLYGLICGNDIPPLECPKTLRV